MSAEKPRSNWWFLLPIFLGIIGGIIAYFVLRHDDPRKAKNCLYLAITLFVIGIVIQVVFGAQLMELENDFGVNT